MNLDQKMTSELVEMMAQTTKFREEGKETLKRQDDRMDRIEAMLGAPGNGTKGDKMYGHNGYKTVGARLLESAEEMQKGLGTTHRYIFRAGNLFAPSEGKSVVGSSDVGYTAPGGIGAERVSGDIVTGARRRLMIRDLLVSKPVTSGIAEYLKEVSFTSAASPQTEASLKGESTFAVSAASQKISTVAHFCQVTQQLLADLPELKNYLDQSMLYFLALKAESEILNGDNLGSHMNGITIQATAYAGTYAAAGDTKIDKANHYLLELANADEMGTAFVLNPTDWHAMQLAKQETGGVNTGSYLLADPSDPGAFIATPTLWGKPVVVTKSMTAGKCLCGNFGMAVLATRMDATVDISIVANTNFTTNQATILAELRETVLVTRPSAFRFGAI